MTASTYVRQKPRTWPKSVASVRSWQHTFDGLVSAEFLNSMSDDHQRRRHERMFAIEWVVYRVAAANDGDLIGFCPGGPSRRPTYAAQSEIYAIYLMPGFERRGIGRRLFENVVAGIAASGRKGLFLTALSVIPTDRSTPGSEGSRQRPKASNWEMRFALRSLLSGISCHRSEPRTNVGSAANILHFS